MEKQADKNAILLNRLQEREREQFLVLSICKTLAEALSKSEFHTLVNDVLKEYLAFEDFILASSNDDENDYQIFYQFSEYKTDSDEKYPLNDGFFDLCMNSADTVIFDLKSITDNKLPNYLQSNNNKNFKNGIGICLPYLKGSQNVLFLFFKSAAAFSRESNRIIRGIGTHLSITVRNIKMALDYESNVSQLKLLQKNLSQRKPEAVVSNTEGFQGIVGKSEAMQKVYELISQVAPSQSTVLIFGETGTGKELIANAIHKLSEFSKERMVKVNCASIPENLIESELFGHEKGAFTGATDVRIGKFEQAENSTIFLDEIGELPLALQGKLLRFLQEKEVERIGGRKPFKINVRVIAATNRSLEKEVAEGRFRSDLYYRLNVFPIALPALRERPEDIEVLGNFFLETHSQKIGKNVKGFSKKVLNKMNANAWPGNVRELENMVERSILFAKEELIKEMTFPKIFTLESSIAPVDFSTKTLQEVEKEHILKVIKKCNGRISGPQGAAVLLGLPSTTLASRMQKLGIKKEHFLS
ncbi:sigma-54-dependent Fis family transcriptional regulator [Flavobacterium sp. SORGH_AS_0622]|uniref:sigma-54 interaction domain-containing protein n=1 Tax=Flavobacterium sp. SORGH_AS_0622 TaxID=3041772 RepID=UPI002782C208|nr:sigma-54 dependent transcriptional regulator [Flavobacterium sp. SORGH_AS_0622]MDQ1165601.1 formate hydrogenlyase transcriptional activator [Flavobacterium sp. SORGH_AS_0622]